MSQKQVPSPTTIPPEILQMAKEAQLGELHKVYSASNKETKGAGIAFIVIGIFFLSMAVIASGLFTPPSIDTMSRFLLTLPLSILGVLAFLAGAITIYQVIHHYRHVYLWQNGFIYEKGKARQVFRWDQIDSIKGSVRKMEYHPQNPRLAVKQIIYDYKVRHQNGDEIELSNVFPEIDELGGVLLEEPVRQFAPQKVNVVDPEKVAVFTDFTLDRQGISKTEKRTSKRKETDNERERVAWAEIWEVAIKDGTPIVRKAERENTDE